MVSDKQVPDEEEAMQHDHRDQSGCDQQSGSRFGSLVETEEVEQEQLQHHHEEETFVGDFQAISREEKTSEG
jgi:hypothetical protein